MKVAIYIYQMSYNNIYVTNNINVNFSNSPKYNGQGTMDFKS